MQKSGVTTQKMLDFTRRRASSAEPQVERLPTTLALLQASPHSLPIFYFEVVELQNWPSYYSSLGVMEWDGAFKNEGEGSYL